MSTVGGIVIHHRHFPDVLLTVDRLIAEGIPPRLLVVVDNSEDPDIESLLRERLHRDSSLEVMANRGYGPAVNRGVDLLSRLSPALDRILVSTHETLPMNGAVRLLQKALDEDRQLAVVGPTLITKEGTRRVYWSWGGIRTRLLNEPRHVGAGIAVREALLGGVEDRAWLDGAFCLYRADILTEMRFREDFFLYFEETEMHTRLRNTGHSVGWVPSATVEQSSHGVPPYLLARNLQRYQLLHGSRIQSIITVPIVILRRAIRKLVKGGPSREIIDMLRGWRAGIRG